MSGFERCDTLFTCFDLHCTKIKCSFAEATTTKYDRNPMLRATTTPELYLLLLPYVDIIPIVIIVNIFMMYSHLNKIILPKKPGCVCGCVIGIKGILESSLNKNMKQNT